MSKRKEVRAKLHVKRRQLYQLKRSGDKRLKQAHNYILPAFLQIQREKVVLKAPKDFNLQYQNCVKVIEYINQIKTTAAQKKNIIIDLEDVTDLREGAVAMLLSVMREVKQTHGIFISGSEPKLSKAKLALQTSGFYRFVNRQSPQLPIPGNRNSLHMGYRHTGIGFLGQEIRKAMDTVWGVQGRNPLLRGTIYEMMRNSVDHAFHQAESIRWHLAISHDVQNKLVKFSFVDNGRGILRSLNTSKLRAFINKFVDGADVLDTAFRNGIQSRTGLSWRGTGLPFIYETHADRIIKNFLVISNNVFIHYDKGRTKLLRVSFEGTYYYWEIDTSCQKAAFI